MLLICYHLVIPNFVIADTETTDDCSSVDRTVYVSVLVSNGQYSFGVSESSLTEASCIQFRLTNYDFQGDNYTLHHLDINPNDSPGVNATHRSFPTDGSFKLVNVFIPSGLSSLTIYCGDDNHRDLGLVYTFMVHPPTSDVYVPPPPIKTSAIPTVTQTRVRVPGFEFPFVCLAILVTFRKLRHW